MYIKTGYSRNPKNNVSMKIQFFLRPRKLVSKNIQIFTVSSLSLILIGFVFYCCFIYKSVVDFTKSRKSKISRKCEFQPIKSLEITLTITLTINLRLTTFCEIDPNLTKIIFVTCSRLLVYYRVWVGFRA